MRSLAARAPSHLRNASAKVCRFAALKHKNASHGEGSVILL